MPTQPSVPVRSFEDAWRLADGVPGWLTEAQGYLLWESALALGTGATIVEIGSHQGRSTVVLGLAARQVGACVVAVDPFVEGRLFGGKTTRQRFESTIAGAGLTDVVRLLPEYSTRVRQSWRTPVDLLYVDGKHDYWTCRDDLRWRSFLPPGAIVLVHDAFSSIGVTAAMTADVLIAGHLRYRSRAGSLALLEVGPAGLASRAAAVRELPWFLRNVWIKVLLRLRLRPVARVFGHGATHDPY